MTANQAPYCWRFTSRVYHVTLDRKTTVCGQGMTGVEHLKWHLSDLGEPPLHRQMCRRCERQASKQQQRPFYKTILPHLLPLLDPLPEPKEQSITEPTLLRRLECARGHFGYGLEQLRHAQRLAKIEPRGSITRQGLRHAIDSGKDVLKRVTALTDRLDHPEPDP